MTIVYIKKSQMLKLLTKFFGSKSERDIKAVKPLVDKINAVYAELNTLTNDELRLKTAQFKQIIAERLTGIDEEIAQLKAQSTEKSLEVTEKSKVYDALDKLTKDRDAELEKVLADILPDAFAVMKETARRFTENEKIQVTASAFDREIAAKKPNVTIDGDQAYWANSWLAAGSEVKWNMIHYDVQLIGGIVLHQGKIAQMATGEGKTLVGTLPAYLNALAGCGVHVVTVNDYLARRDSEWNAPIFEFHGLRVDCIDKYYPNSPERANAYKADITYGTNNEFGFDYLRDNMSQTPDQLVQGKLHFAMVDEVDSVLIDDARTPLIISGPVPFGDQHEFYELKPRIERLVNAQRAYITQVLNSAKKLINEGNTGVDEGEGGLALLRAYRGLPKNKALIKFLSESGVKQVLLKTENHYMQEQSKNMHKVDAELYFYIDEKNNQVELTEKGLELITKSSEDHNFFVLPDIGTTLAEIEHSDKSTEDKVAEKDALMRDYAVKSERIHSINQLLKAYTLFEKDVEYILDEDKVKIVDEQTGRIMDGRRYSDGLHQAIEAKENVKVEDATQTYATITLQNYFRMYHKLCGMTGTATTEAGEFWQIYKLDVVEIPTNRPISRDDRDDHICRTTNEKYNIIVKEIEELTQQGRPVLVGTTSVENSEKISRMLKLRGVKHNVLNAKLHQKEADIVAEAGVAGTVTIATNMAGRGTDIKLGEGVKASGGLAIIGTERHESRRVDRQLRGRAGRQGDPGSSQFFVSFEDNLMRLFGSAERMSKMVQRMLKEGDTIQDKTLTRIIENAQKKVEENNFGIRKRLLEFDDVMNSQRSVIYAKRKNALYGQRLDVDMNNMAFDVAEDLVNQNKQDDNFDAFKMDVIKHFSVETQITQKDFQSKNVHALTDTLFHEVTQFYARKSQAIKTQAMPVLQQVFTERGDHIEHIVIPFTDGIRGIQVPVSLRKAILNDGDEVVAAFEKTIILALIDETWKEHLREMDELKQSVQNAVYEQKDPLVIYKMEAFNLFRQMLANVNKEVISFLYKGGIPVTQDAEHIEEAQAPKANDKQIKASKAEMGSILNGGGMETEDTRELEPQQPIRNDNKIGRNDPCPCGSGKKYKACHGQEA